MQKIKTIPTVEEAFNRLSALCARQECCQSDLADKMMRQGMTETSVAQVLQHLQSEGFVNEERFARAFARDKLLFARWGKQRISMELHRKRISSQFIDGALRQLDANEYKKVLKEVLYNYNKSLKAKSGYERRMKLLRHAFGRGFSQDEATEYVDELCGNAEDNDF